MSKKENEESRSKNWATVVYPESAPENWFNIVQDNYLCGYVSPLHDSDCEETGEKKKEHWHVLLKFPSQKSREQVLELVKKFGGVGAERIANSRSYARYLCHLDQPHKFQYNVADVREFGGADYQGEIASSSDKYLIIGEMTKYLDIHMSEMKFSFARFFKYCRDNEESWYRGLCDNCAYIIKEYLQSAKWEYEEAKKNLAYDEVIEACKDSDQKENSGSESGAQDQDQKKVVNLTK